ncbi:hypothetical protein ACFUTX_07490 [Microbacterium sp. NPDC057407]|uniref:hypothetical protein n=1 Tax=Microbacterium sp. NPDC057407 TaxID=3346120 RepID=UPI003671CD1B
MTALIGPRSARVTRFERMLLVTAAAMDRFVAGRLEHRASSSRTWPARFAAGERRADAMAMGSIGMLPR